MALCDGTDSQAQKSAEKEDMIRSVSEEAGGSLAAFGSSTACEATGQGSVGHWVHISTLPFASLL